MFRSVRPAVLLVLAVAVACTDQPTEPTESSEPIGGLRATLAPPPAPPTLLSGDLAANEGGPSQVDLGDYESPVYSKVTVSGLLGYQGAGGYLPGTGQIDASGVVIQNQCDLIVVVRSATGIIGGANTCPSQPRQIDSYVKYALVNGHVDAYRTTGPPGSCWKYPVPCIHFTGSQSITVEPQEGNIILTPSKTSVAAGGGIIITAKGVWAENNTTVVPMTVRQWTWEGSGTEVGGGHTKVCAAYAANQCTVQVYQSGTVTLEALVNGKVKTKSVQIAVIGGDTLPLPPPPDTIPHEPPGDSGGDGDGGGDGGGGGGCSGPDCGDSLVVDLNISRQLVLPVLSRRRFDAVTQQTFRIDTLTGARTNFPSEERLDTLTVTAVVRRASNGEPVPGVTLKAEAEPIDSSGGHIHTGHVPRPEGSFYPNGENAQATGPGAHRRTLTLVTDSLGMASATYRTSGVGGLERLVATITAGGRGTPDTAVVVVRVHGLVEMAGSMNERYVFNEQDPNVSTQQHGNNNRWIQPAFRDSVLEIFDDFFQLGGTVSDPGADDRFVITDVGLEYGGLYDFDRATEWGSPHMTHRIGNDMDIRSRNLSAAQEAILTRACRTNASTRPPRTAPRVFRCTFETAPLHLHVEGLNR